LNRMNRSKPTLSGGRSYMAYPSEPRRIREVRLDSPALWTTLVAGINAFSPSVVGSPTARCSVRSSVA
jgi:hypothetical protein